MTEPRDTEDAPEIAPDEEPENVEPAFDVDLAPEDQGTADAAAEQSG